MIDLDKIAAEIDAAAARDFGFMPEDGSAEFSANEQRIYDEEDAAKLQHDCDDHATPYTSDGPLGHGWECEICGKFLQAG